MSNKLKIAVTSRALFRLENENKLYQEKGKKAYEEYQIEKENEILNKGAAFSLIKSLLSINTIDATRDKVEVLLVTRNNANTGIRVFNSIDQYGLDITRGVFTSGGELTPYLSALNIDLFLTANPKDAQAAIDAGIPAATLLTDNIPEYDDSIKNQIRIAFEATRFCLPMIQNSFTKNKD